MQPTSSRRFVQFMTLSVVFIGIGQFKGGMQINGYTWFCAFMAFICLALAVVFLPQPVRARHWE